jgi:hypothetical protein
MKFVGNASGIYGGRAERTFNSQHEPGRGVRDCCLDSRPRRINRMWRSCFLERPDRARVRVERSIDTGVIS